ncbi:hypothetical protein H9L39_03564 [Fusarium oxysporum f. sp. albedinis]|nr:hypothetical protein H9L39_03564 [Fusarium oxysporum f. sp. albedinis]
MDQIQPDATDLISIVCSKKGRPPSVIHVPEVEMPRKRAAEPEAQREKSEKRELNKHFQR